MAEPQKKGREFEAHRKKVAQSFPAFGQRSELVNIYGRRGEGSLACVCAKNAAFGLAWRTTRERRRRRGPFVRAEGTDASGAASKRAISRGRKRARATPKPATAMSASSQLPWSPLRTRLQQQGHRAGMTRVTDRRRRLSMSTALSTLERPPHEPRWQPPPQSTPSAFWISAVRTEVVRETATASD